MSNQPLSTVRIGGIKATIWENEDDKGIARYNTTITRTYLDQNKEWQENNSFSLDDLPRLRLATEQAFTQIHERIAERHHDKSNNQEEPDASEDPAPAATKQGRGKKSFTEKVDAERAKASGAAK
ncbi:hypothetical protein AAFN60_18965 [Roseibacillus persicicus]|uniref:hypothetical protein n=1 Tax=Roseibacillus persicicus TaxID=454148 RepID=UPI00398A79B2